MKLNLDILADGFESSRCFVCHEERSRYDLPIRRITLGNHSFQTPVTDPDRNRSILFVCDVATLSRIDHLEAGCLAISCRDREEFELAISQLQEMQNKFPAMAVMFEEGPTALLDTLERRANELDAWDERLLDVVLRHGEPSELLEIGAEMLENPIALFDSSLSLVSYAGYLPDTYRETVWKDVLERGYTPMSFFGKDEREHLRLAGTRQEFLLLKPQREHGRSQFSVPVKTKEGMRIGSLGQVDLVAPFTPGQISLTLHLRDRLVELEALHMDFCKHTPEFEHYVTLFLQGSDISRGAMGRQLSLHGWDPDDKYRVILYPSYSDNQSTIDNPEMSQYLGHLKATFPASLLIDLDDRLAMVVRDRDYAHTMTRLSNMLFDAFAEDFRICGVSDVLASFYDVRIGLAQAHITLNEAIHAKQTGAITFDDVYETHLVHTLQTGGTLERLYHPAILKLVQESCDCEETLRYLYSYLMSGCNVSKAAKRLYMHRNTLVYRLERLKTALEIELEELDTHETFRLALSCALALACYRDELHSQLQGAAREAHAAGNEDY